MEFVINRIELKIFITSSTKEQIADPAHLSLVWSDRHKGIWTNGQCDYGQAFDRVIALAKAAGIPAAQDVAAARATASFATAHVAMSATTQVAAQAQAPATAQAKAHSNQQI